MQYFSDEQLDDMFRLLDLGQLQMMGYDSVYQVSDQDDLEDLLLSIEEDFSNLDREEKIAELRSIGSFEDDELVDEVKMSAETKRQRLKREKDEAAMDEASTDVDYMREHYSEEGNTPVMPPHEFGEPVQWRPYDDRISALKRQRAESLLDAGFNTGETLVLVADRDTEIKHFRFHYSADYEGVIDDVSVDEEGAMKIKKGDIVLFHIGSAEAGWAASASDDDAELVGYFEGDYYDSGEPEYMWGIEDPAAWTLMETVSDEQSPNWGGRDSEPRIVHTPGGRSWRFTISGVGKGDNEVEAFNDFVKSNQIGKLNKWDQERMSAETFAADSPFNTLLQIRDEVIIEEEDDFNTLLQIYLSLENDIAAMYTEGMEKHALLPEMMRYRNQIAHRLDEIQDEVEIQDTIQMDSEHQEASVPFTLQKPLRTGYKMGLGWVGAALTLPLLILGVGSYFNQESNE